MTLEEKLAQLGSIWVVRDPRRRPRRARQGAGAPRGGHRADHARGRRHELRDAGRRRAGQRDPALPRGGDAPGHPGHRPRGVPARARRARRGLLPAVDRRWRPRGIRSWSRRSPRSFARQLRAMGAHQGLAPIFDVARDPRWGRIEETYGEDPYLIAALGVAYVRGLQERRRRAGAGHRQAHGRPRPAGGRHEPRARRTSARASCATSTCGPSRRPSARRGCAR